MNENQLDPRLHFVVATAIIVKDGKYLTVKRGPQEKVFPNVRAIDPNFFDLGQRSEETFVLHVSGCSFGSISFAEHGRQAEKQAVLPSFMPISLRAPLADSRCHTFPTTVPRHREVRYCSRNRV